MPLYEYRCTQCGHHFEKIQHFNSTEETECPKCHGKLERPLTAPAFNFKGAGWYVNDYAPKAASSSSDSKSADSKSSDSAAASADTKSSSSESTASAPATSSTSDSASKPAASESAPKSSAPSTSST